MALTAAQARHIDRPGRHHDGRGLYLNVAKGGSKSWVQRVTIDGRRREIGLGGYPTVSLAQARRKADDNRSAVAHNRDPIAEKRRADVPTFREAAEKVHALNLPRWRNDHHADFWLRSLELHAAGIWPRRLDQIKPADVIACLEPCWTTKAETMRRVRQRIQTVMRWGMAHGFIDRNPAGEIISAALPSQPKVREHLPALHYLEVPDALEAVRSSRASMAAKLAVEFVALTAARSGEARGATWAEIDLDAALWTVPASRMKGKVEHRVPLSTAALDVLDAAKGIYDGSDYVFPSPLRPGREMPPQTLLKVLRDHGITATVHGFRSSFRSWALEQTDAPWAVAEACLAHRLGTAVEQAYVRTDMLDQRRGLMQRWADFIGS